MFTLPNETATFILAYTVRKSDSILRRFAAALHRRHVVAVVKKIVYAR